MRLRLKMRSFNPLPLPKQGETSFLEADGILIGVSIRSPYRSKGRRIRAKCTMPHRLFQSAPLTEARGDRNDGMVSRYVSGFNPLPLPKQGETWMLPWMSLPWSCFNPLPLPKQGETVPSDPDVPGVPVSIRSPYRSKGRLDHAKIMGTKGAFQSAPLTEARGDSCWERDSSKQPLFQSAPLTEARGDANRPTWIL